MSGYMRILRATCDVSKLSREVSLPTLITTVNWVYEDDLCVAFKDVNPVAPTHVLVVPKHREGLTQLRFATPDHEAILGHLLW